MSKVKTSSARYLQNYILQTACGGTMFCPGRTHLGCTTSARLDAVFLSRIGGAMIAILRILDGRSVRLDAPTGVRCRDTAECTIRLAVSGMPPTRRQTGKITGLIHRYGSSSHPSGKKKRFPPPAPCQQKVPAKYLFAF
ncbi:MAG: hypothetical protein Q7S66_04645 [bacterium]|nr:hypothetical protein [bacterium]